MQNITIAQTEVIAGRPDLNCAKMLSAVETAKKQGGKIIVFPAMALTGWFLGDTWQFECFVEDAKKYGEKIVEASQDITIIFGNVAGDAKGHLYSATYVAQNGKLIGGQKEYSGAVAVKKNLNWIDKRYFTPAPQDPQPITITIEGQSYSFIFLIGEDIMLTPKGPKVDYIIYLNNRAFAWTKTNYAIPFWANRLQACLIQVNMVGIQNTGKTVYAMPGGSSVYNQHGESLQQLPLWQESIYTLPFDPRIAQIEEPEQYESVYFSLNKPKISYVYQAIVFSIAQFVKSIQQKRVVIGLSGGIDSAVTACLYAKALGPENILLVNMPSRFNSQTTQNCAEQLARELGCYYTAIPIEQSVEHTKKQINGTIITNLQNGKKEKLKLSDFMVENIQARDRGSRLLPAIASAWDAVYSCNGNKAEASIGYFTMYGDGTGFFAPIGDLWKWQVYELARYMQEAIFQKPILQDIIDLPPSAELSPAQDVEKGLGDPLVYPYHDHLFAVWADWINPAGPDKLLSWYMEGTLGAKINCEDPGLVYRLFPTPQDFIQDLEKWWTLYTGLATVKKQQMPPILTVDCYPYRRKPFSIQTTYFPLEYIKLKEQILGQNK